MSKREVPFAELIYGRSNFTIKQDVSGFVATHCVNLLEASVYFAFRRPKPEWKKVLISYHDVSRG